MKYIITHPGQAHRDEFLAIGLFINCNSSLPVYRREPTEEELNNPEVVVIDVGLRHQPELNNFDHHQLPRGTVCCALELVAKHVGLHDILSTKDWYKTTSLVDSTGPFNAAKVLGLPRFPFELWSPVEDAILQMFEGDTSFVKLSTYVMRTLIKEANEVHAQLIELRQKAHIDGIMLVFDAVPNAEAINLYRRELVANGYDIALSISRDDRSDGWALYRYADDPRVDFSVLSGHPQVVFTHASGFIAKTKAMSLDEAKSLAWTAVRSVL